MSKNYHYHGPGFLSLLALIFITLKLTGVIDWSWWLVLAPFLIPFFFILAILIFMFCIALAVSITEGKDR